MTQKTTQRTNSQKARKNLGILARFTAMVGAMLKSNENITRGTARKRVAHRNMMFGYGENPIFIPRKHPIMNYRTQQRIALKKRRAK